MEEMTCCITGHRDIPDEQPVPNATVTWWNIQTV